MQATLPCPCGSQNPYGDCCEPYLTGTQPAPTAEALMRSRYTAYVLGKVEYLIATHHPTRRSPGDRAQLTQTVQRTTWLGLTILHCQQGQPGDTIGTVEFIARYQSGEVAQIHERSRFVRQRGRWFYVEGDHLPPVEPKRNEPCWCNSGKKFKQCHGR